ncbi:MAG: HEPN domain-containing protein [Candidatus Sumerlaeaceae bacterium]
MEEQLLKLIKYRLNEADEAVDSSTLLLENGHYRAAMNRAYYAMFYAVLALLCSKGLSTRKHSGAITLFDREFVKPGSFNKQMSEWLHRAFELRNMGDYEAWAEVGPEDAQLSAEQAAEFLRRVRTYFDEQ